MFALHSKCFSLGLFYSRLNYSVILLICNYDKPPWVNIYSRYIIHQLLKTEAFDMNIIWGLCYFLAECQLLSPQSLWAR